MNTGKADGDGRARANRFHRPCRGIGDGMQAQETGCNTGGPSGDRSTGSTGSSREIGWAVWGDGEARSTDETG
jgi:hypothetical protein